MQFFIYITGIRSALDERLDDIKFIRLASFEAFRIVCDQLCISLENKFFFNIVDSPLQA
jgi:hypothetical protein